MLGVENIVQISQTAIEAYNYYWEIYCTHTCPMQLIKNDNNNNNNRKQSRENILNFPFESTKISWNTSWFVVASFSSSFSVLFYNFISRFIHSIRYAHEIRIPYIRNGTRKSSTICDKCVQCVRASKNNHDKNQHNVIIAFCANNFHFFYKSCISNAVRCRWLWIAFYFIKIWMCVHYIFCPRISITFFFAFLSLSVCVRSCVPCISFSRTQYAFARTEWCINACDECS